MMRNRPLYLLLLIGVVVAAVACDNVGRAFDPDVDPPDPGGEFGISTIQVVPVGGDARSGRPTVRATYPEGSGWPSSVPIVVEFSESLNEQTILPTTARRRCPCSGSCVPCAGRTCWVAAAAAEREARAPSRR